MTSMSTRKWRAGAALALSATLAWSGAAIAAGVPDALTKLKGSSESNASDALSKAGYRLQGAKESWNRKDAFWWNEKSRQCLRLTSRFSLVSGVATVGAADCTNAGTAGAAASGRPGTLTASDLLGLSRKGGEAKLAAAGFNALWIDEGKPDGITMLWFNQSTGQCIAATVVGDKFDAARDQPASQCR